MAMEKETMKNSSPINIEGIGKLLAKTVFSPKFKTQTKTLIKKVLEAQNNDNVPGTDSSGQSSDLNESSDFRDAPKFRKTSRLKLNSQGKGKSGCIQKHSVDTASKDENKEIVLTKSAPESLPTSRADAFTPQISSVGTESSHDTWQGEASGTTKCPLCSRQIPKVSYEEHRAACLQDKFRKGSGSEVNKKEKKCQVCDERITDLNSRGQTQHINNCLDRVEKQKKLEEEHEEKLHLARDAVLPCPLCNRNFKTEPSRKAHVRKCFKDNKMTVEQLQLRMKQQREAYEANLNAGILPEDFKATNSKSKTSKARCPKHPKIALDEETQLALALSSSMVEDHNSRQNDFVQHRGQTAVAGGDQIADQSFAIDTLLKNNSRAQTKGRKGKQKEGSSLLHTVSREQAAERISNRVDRFIFSAVQKESKAKTPPFKGKSRLQGERGSLAPTEVRGQSETLWQKTSLGVPSASHEEGRDSGEALEVEQTQQQESRMDFYVNRLMPPIRVSDIATGSKIKRLSSIPGRRKSSEKNLKTGSHSAEDEEKANDSASPEECCSPPASQPLSPSQTVQDLAQLALENECSPTDVDRDEPLRWNMAAVNTNSDNVSTVSNGDPLRSNISENFISGTCGQTGGMNTGPQNTHKSPGRSANPFSCMAGCSLYSDVSVRVTRSNTDSPQAGNKIKKISAHKIVLHVQCPALLKLCVKVEGSEDEIDLTEYDEQAVLDFLRLVYDGAEDDQQAEGQVKLLINRFLAKDECLTSGCFDRSRDSGGTQSCRPAQSAAQIKVESSFGHLAQSSGGTKDVGEDNPDNVRRQEDVGEDDTDNVRRQEDVGEDNPDNVRRQEDVGEDDTDNVRRQEDVGEDDTDNVRRQEDVGEDNPDNVRRQEDVGEDDTDNVRRQENVGEDNTDNVRRQEDVTEDNTDKVRRQEDVGEDNTDNVRRQEDDTEDNTDNVRRQEDVTEDNTDNVRRQEDVTEDKSDILRRQEDVTEDNIDNVEDMEMSVSQQDDLEGDPSLNHVTVSGSVVEQRPLVSSEDTMAEVLDGQSSADKPGPETTRAAGPVHLITPETLARELKNVINEHAKQHEENKAGNKELESVIESADLSGDDIICCDEVKSEIKTECIGEDNDVIFCGAEKSKLESDEIKEESVREESFNLTSTEMGEESKRKMEVKLSPSKTQKRKRVTGKQFRSCIKKIELGDNISDNELENLRSFVVKVEKSNAAGPIFIPSVFYDEEGNSEELSITAAIIPEKSPKVKKKSSSNSVLPVTVRTTGSNNYPSVSTDILCSTSYSIASMSTTNINTLSMTTIPWSMSNIPHLTSAMSASPSISLSSVTSIPMSISITSNAVPVPLSYSSIPAVVSVPLSSSSASTAVSIPLTNCSVPTAMNIHPRTASLTSAVSATTSIKTSRVPLPNPSSSSSTSSVAPSWIPINFNISSVTSSSTSTSRVTPSCQRETSTASLEHLDGDGVIEEQHDEVFSDADLFSEEEHSPVRKQDSHAQSSAISTADSIPQLVAGSSFSPRDLTTAQIEAEACGKPKSTNSSEPAGSCSQRRMLLQTSASKESGAISEVSVYGDSQGIRDKKYRTESPAHVNHSAMEQTSKAAGESIAFTSLKRMPGKTNLPSSQRERQTLSTPVKANVDRKSSQLVRETTLPCQEKQAGNVRVSNPSTPKSTRSPGQAIFKSPSGTSPSPKRTVRGLARRNSPLFKDLKAEQLLGGDNCSSFDSSHRLMTPDGKKNEVLPTSESSRRQAEMSACRKTLKFGAVSSASSCVAGSAVTSAATSASERSFRAGSYCQSPLPLRQRLQRDIPFGSSSSKASTNRTSEGNTSQTSVTEPDDMESPDNKSDVCLPGGTKSKDYNVYFCSTEVSPVVKQVDFANDDDDLRLFVEEMERRVETQTKENQLRTPPTAPRKSCASKQWKEPSPFTPMLPYDSMNTPQLKQEVSKIGVRPVGKKRMKQLLKQVYQQTHQYETDSDYEGTPVKRPKTTEINLQSLRTEQTNSKLSANSVGHSNPDHQTEASGDTTVRKPVVESLPKSNEEDLPNSQGSSHSEEGDLPEESILQGWPEEEEEMAPTQMTQTSAEILHDKVIQFIQDNRDIHEDILMYRPLELDVLKQRLTDAGIRVGMEKLMNLLDDRCITFTMKNMSTRNHQKRPQKKDTVRAKPKGKK